MPSLERVAKVVSRLNPELELSLSSDMDGAVFAGEREDFEEMIGNLVENAAKWAAGRVEVRLHAEGNDRFRVTIDDDGPGLSPEEQAEATKRGRRLDEAKPGSGLGLSIVADTVLQYRGEFRLGNAPIGGLRAELLLPRAVEGTMS